MSYRIEMDDSSNREPFGYYAYRIYQDDRLIARYWHNHRGDEHGIEFVDGTAEECPLERVTDFIQGGGPEPLMLSDRALVYLKSRY